MKITHSAVAIVLLILLSVGLIPIPQAHAATVSIFANASGTCSGSSNGTDTVPLWQIGVSLYVKGVLTSRYPGDDQSMINALAIADAESGGNNDSVGCTSDGIAALGIYQVQYNSHTNLGYSATQLTDPGISIDAMLTIYNELDAAGRTQGWWPWIANPVAKKLLEGTDSSAEAASFAKAETEWPKAKAYITANYAAIVDPFPISGKPSGTTGSSGTSGTPAPATGPTFALVMSPFKGVEVQEWQAFGCTDFNLEFPSALCDGSANTKASSYGSNLHNGLDLVGLGGNGTPTIYSVLPGNVTEVDHLTTGYGTAVYVDSGGGIQEIYAHLVAGSTTVGRGDHVGYQQALGLMGGSGNTSGPHLHIAITNALGNVNLNSLVLGPGGSPSSAAAAGQGGAPDALPNLLARTSTKGSDNNIMMPASINPTMIGGIGGYIQTDGSPLNGLVQVTPSSAAPVATSNGYAIPGLGALASAAGGGALLGGRANKSGSTVGDFFSSLGGVAQNFKDCLGHIESTTSCTKQTTVVDPCVFSASMHLDQCITKIVKDNLGQLVLAASTSIFQAIGSQLATWVTQISAAFAQFNFFTATPSSLTYDLKPVIALTTVSRNIVFVLGALFVFWIGFRRMWLGFIGARVEPVSAVLGRLVLVTILGVSSIWWIAIMFNLADGLTQFIFDGAGFGSKLLPSDRVSALLGDSGILKQLAGGNPLLAFIVLLLVLAKVLLFMYLMFRMLVRIGILDFLIVIAPIGLFMYGIEETAEWGRRWSTTFFTTLFQQAFTVLILCIALGVTGLFNSPEAINSWVTTTATNPKALTLPPAQSNGYTLLALGSIRDNAIQSPQYGMYRLLAGATPVPAATVALPTGAAGAPARGAGAIGSAASGTPISTAGSPGLTTKKPPTLIGEIVLFLLSCALLYSVLVIPRILDVQRLHSNLGQFLEGLFIVNALGQSFKLASALPGPLGGAAGFAGSLVTGRSMGGGGKGAGAGGGALAAGGMNTRIPMTLNGDDVGDPGQKFRKIAETSNGKPQSMIGWQKDAAIGGWQATISEGGKTKVGYFAPTGQTASGSTGGAHKAVNPGGRSPRQAQQEAQQTSLEDPGGSFGADDTSPLLPGGSGVTASAGSGRQNMFPQTNPIGFHKNALTGPQQSPSDSAPGQAQHQMQQASLNAGSSNEDPTLNSPQVGFLNSDVTGSESQSAISQQRQIGFRKNTPVDPQQAVAAAPGSTPQIAGPAAGGQLTAGIAGGPSSSTSINSAGAAGSKRQARANGITGSPNNGVPPIGLSAPQPFVDNAGPAANPALTGPSAQSALAASATTTPVAAPTTDVIGAGGQGRRLGTGGSAPNDSAGRQGDGGDRPGPPLVAAGPGATPAGSGTIPGGVGRGIAPASGQPALSRGSNPAFVPLAASGQGSQGGFSPPPLPRPNASQLSGQSSVLRPAGTTVPSVMPTSALPLAPVPDLQRVGNDFVGPRQANSGGSERAGVPLGRQNPAPVAASLPASAPPVESSSPDNWSNYISPSNVGTAHALAGGNNSNGSAASSGGGYSQSSGNSYPAPAVSYTAPRTPPPAQSRPDGTGLSGQGYSAPGGGGHGYSAQPFPQERAQAPFVNQPGVQSNDAPQGSRPQYDPPPPIEMRTRPSNNGQQQFNSPPADVYSPAPISPRQRSTGPVADVSNPRQDDPFPRTTPPGPT